MGNKSKSKGDTKSEKLTGETQSEISKEEHKGKNELEKDRGKRGNRRESSHGNKIEEAKKIKETETARLDSVKMKGKSYLDSLHPSGLKLARIPKIPKKFN